MDFSRSKIISIIVVCLLGLLISLGNFFNLGVFSKNKVNLGLDLKGGSQLLLKIDYDTYLEDQLNFTLSELRSELRKNKIRAVPQIKIKTNNENEKLSFIALSSVADDMKEIKKIVKDINSNLSVDKNGEDVEIVFSKSAIDEAKYNLLMQSMEIVRRRIDETGTKEPTIQAQGKDRILVQVPGMASPDELKKVLGKTAKMTFHFVNTSIMNETLIPNNVIAMNEMNSDFVYYVEKEIALNGDLLKDAFVSFSDGQPSVAFKMNSIGAKRFSEITKNNIGRPLAIVLDNEVITAPRINSHIMGGEGIISGNFTIDDANRVALLLRAGALPAPLEIIEERVVGPSLGEDSIKSGLQACALGLVVVFVFMLALYKFFGILSTITLMINLVLTLAILSLLNATLTLPGIAGIVLSIGMAVDTNILILERIKEEYKETKKVYNSVSNGFNYAWATIFDSNITTIIVSIILYALGTGAVKGFALVLAIGILTSMFSGVLLTKLLLYVWLEKFQPRKINI